MSVLSSPLRRRLSRLTAVVMGLGSWALALSLEGCLFGSDCEASGRRWLGGERGPCESERSVMLCRGGEGHYYWESEACESGDVCVDRTVYGGVCQPETLGQPCQTQRDCGPRALCDGHSCQTSSLAQGSACSLAPTVTVSHGQVIPLEVTLPAAPPVFGPTFWPSACGESEGGEQVYRLDLKAGARPLRIRIEADPEAQDPGAGSVRLYVRERCTGPEILPERASVRCGLLSEGLGLTVQARGYGTRFLYVAGAAAGASGAVRLQIVAEP